MCRLVFMKLYKFTVTFMAADFKISFEIKAYV